MSIIKVERIHLLLLSFLFLGYTQQITLSASAQGAKQNSPVKKKLLHSQEIEQEPSTTYLPKFPGSKFIRGLSKSGLTSGACYHLRYGCMEQPQRVSDWFENALKANGFRISEKNKVRLTAIRPDVGVCVMLVLQPFPVYNGKDMHYKTYYQIRYVETPVSEPKK